MTDTSTSVRAPIDVAGKPVCDALAIAANFLVSQQDAASAAVDARRLLQQALDCRSLDLLVSPDRTLTAAESENFLRRLARRKGGEPVSRIAGRREFYGREFVITPATLDPRPESETLIDATLALLRSSSFVGDGLQILDIGTGSGCLLLTLLAELPGARGVGVDPSVAALGVAEQNAVRLGLAHRARWVEGRGTAGLVEPFQLVVSNPPYIPTLDIAALDSDVREFDPVGALDGGIDGLDIYKQVACDLGAMQDLRWVVFEVGVGQASIVTDIMREALPVVNHGTANDLAGVQRCVALQLHARRA